MKYEIIYPDAKKMIEHERACDPQIVPLKNYQNGTVANYVSNEIERDVWYEMHHSAVELVVATLAERGNAEGWQLMVLQEAFHRLRDGRLSQYSPEVQQWDVKYSVKKCIKCDHYFRDELDHKYHSCEMKKKAS